MAISKWTDVRQVEDFLDRRSTGLIFKHSTRCPISASARSEVESFAAAEPSVAVFIVLVVEERAVSDAISRRLGLPHTSPQAILLRDGKVAWSASHGAVTEEALSEAWRDACVAGGSK